MCVFMSVCVCSEWYLSVLSLPAVIAFGSSPKRISPHPLSPSKPQSPLPASPTSTSSTGSASLNARLCHAHRPTWDCWNC